MDILDQLTSMKEHIRNISMGDGERDGLLVLVDSMTKQVAELINERDDLKADCPSVFVEHVTELKAKLREVKRLATEPPSHHTCAPSASYQLRMIRNAL